MPLVKRAVEPSVLFRQSVSRSVRNELEYVTNSTLSGVVLQLSSLSIHAEDLFGELFTEANLFYARASRLQNRIDKLNVKVTELDSTIEEVSLHDINMRKAFRSSGATDQQIVSRESLSQTLRATYNKADKPPPLQDLNQFRDDGKDALKIYTDPDYFFNLWREAMQKEMRDAKEKRREQRKKERKANPGYRRDVKVKAAVPRSRLKAMQMKHGVELVDSAANMQQNHLNSAGDKAKFQSKHTSPDGKAVTRSSSRSSTIKSKHPHANYPPDQSSSPPHMGNDFPPPLTDLPNPPLPPPLEMNGSIPEYPSPNNNFPPPLDSVPPPPPTNIPPPPAPPPVPDDLTTSTANTGGMAAQLANVRLNKTEANAPVVDSRGGLLQAIREGINLKKVEAEEGTTSKSLGGGNDVASILARRIAVEFSDSESDSFMSDDGEWDE